MKTIIKGSDFADTDLSFSVCSHLKPILDYLVELGNTYETGKPLKRERFGSSVLQVNKSIDMTAVRDKFIIPTFIVLDDTRGRIFCDRCWCEISALTTNLEQK